MMNRTYRECALADRYILVLDHFVLEIFDARGPAKRWHVSQVGVEANVQEPDLLLKVGVRLPNGGISDRGEYTELIVPLSERAQVHEFFAAIRGARQGGTEF
ncbi:hypothetical protein IEU95_12465 [Hoyosella rhizosphaerae]|uniref:Uncharacterized protein n=1 Tax=Hoyosella rhizosphaerae TaxID=1755582 RepID=A0A916U7L5_9ACTN|nr:hypothetical protein [Hoyosella rhizosphaerae]MBN4927649.1 hypothetical protein [Hoyosella rhizosphaerae]GGC62777.1 hypothetical protein GCM10011410_14020 [Hoyosella rhizosphaerae]